MRSFERSFHWVLLMAFTFGLSSPAYSDLNGKSSSVGGYDRANQKRLLLSDLELTEKIRRKISSDKNLSEEAKRVEIITDHGVVILRGSVKSIQDKTILDQAARGAAGLGYVQNEVIVMKQG